eukprot:scaffold6795_cov110-Cylindrotheca_fusiformis.AAC.5
MADAKSLIFVQHHPIKRRAHSFLAIINRGIFLVYITKVLYKATRAQARKTRKTKNQLDVSMSETPQRDVGGENTPPVSVDRKLAAALEKLSLQEREKVYEDVHGVTDEIQETAEFVTNSLEQMDREIESINEKDAYEEAKLQSHSLVTNRQFRLSFLRYTSFNPKMAALHLVQYFSSKQELFGTENLGKSRITLEDLGETTMHVLKLGSLQVLPCRDSKGRAIVVSTPSVLEPAMAECDDLISDMVNRNVSNCSN